MVRRVGLALGLLLAAFAGGFVAQAGKSSAHADGVTAVGFVPYPPTRVLDSRSGSKPSALSDVLVRTGVTGAVAVGVNITMTEPAGPGFVTAWDGASTRPTASVINAATANATIANYAIVPVQPDGSFRLYTNVATHLVVDLMGYFPGSSTPATGAVAASITGYGPSSSFTTVSGVVANGAIVAKTVRVDVRCPNGTVETDTVFDIQPGATKGFQVLCTGGAFTSGATASVVDV